MAVVVAVAVAVAVAVVAAAGAAGAAGAVAVAVAGAFMKGVCLKDQLNEIYRLTLNPPRALPRMLKGFL